VPTPRLDGLDIHDKYQPVTDWAAATNYPLMSCKISEGRSSRPGGLDYFRRFREYGVPHRLGYHWLRSDSSMRQQADVFLAALAKLGGLQQGEGVQADWETTPNIPLVTSDQCMEWCQYIEDEYPGRVIVYSSDWLPDSTLDADARREFDEWFAAFPTYPLWFANYNTGTSATGGWKECEKYGVDVWQYTSSLIVPGIATRCDGNMVMDWSVVRRVCGLVDVPPPDPKPEPPIVVKTTWTFPGGVESMTTPQDYGVAGQDRWWTEMGITPFGLVWSTPDNPDPRCQEVHKCFRALPNLPRAPRAVDDNDMINKMRTHGTAGPCPSTFFNEDGSSRPLSDAWLKYNTDA
jgi:hypothetical protein